MRPLDESPHPVAVSFCSCFRWCDCAASRNAKPINSPGGSLMVKLSHAAHRWLSLALEGNQIEIQFQFRARFRFSFPGPAEEEPLICLLMMVDNNRHCLIATKLIQLIATASLVAVSINCCPANPARQPLAGLECKGRTCQTVLFNYLAPPLQRAAQSCTIMISFAPNLISSRRNGDLHCVHVCLPKHYQSADAGTDN